MLHNERKMWYRVTLVGNFESEIDEDNKTYRSLKFTKKHKGGENS